MKKNYQKPTLEAISFETEDIITTSDFTASIPDMGWGNEEDGWGSMPFNVG